jgi:hypothetical protein
MRSEAVRSVGVGPGGAAFIIADIGDGAVRARD